MGCSSEWGGSPLASSMAVMPRDQISAWGGQDGVNPAPEIIQTAGASANSYLGVVGRLFDDLGRHPEGRSHEGVAFDLSVGELSCHAEVGQLHFSLLGQQHVGSWEERPEAERHRWALFLSVHVSDGMAETEEDRGYVCARYL